MQTRKVTELIVNVTRCRRSALRRSAALLLPPASLGRSFFLRRKLPCLNPFIPILPAARRDRRPSRPPLLAALASAMSTSILLPAYLALATFILLPLVTPIPVSVQMISLSTTVIFIASFNAAARERRRLSGTDPDDAPRDVINAAQAWRFPLVASASLFSMYLAFRYLPKAWVSLALTLYGVVFGGFALASVIAPALAGLKGMPEGMQKEYGDKDWVLVSGVDVLSMLLAAPVAVWYFQTRSWVANNVLAVALALSAIDLLAIGEFQTAVILLCGLFFYDAFWVFGSKSIVKENVMVAVAKNFEGPIKLVFPRVLNPVKGGSDFSILGLGDIVIPGLFVALVQRIDSRKVPVGGVMPPASPRSLPYFTAVMAAYVAGLVATIVAMNVFEAAQPALIYLVPFCVGAVLVLAKVRGEVREVWEYAEEDDEAVKEKIKAAGGTGEEKVAEGETVEGKKVL